MLEVMDREEGVGLAAPQIGVLSRIMVWRDPEHDDERVRLRQSADRRAVGGVHHRRPRGVSRCPGCTVEVERADEVVVEAQDLRGQPYRAGG